MQVSNRNWKVLHVDLTSGKNWVETLSEEIFSKYLGSRGIQAELLWDAVGPGIDPLSPANVLIFGAGCLTGTSAPSTGRTTITFKSPATGAYGKVSAGGFFGLILKFSGHDSIMIHGKADSPVYVFVDNEKVSVRSAEHVWGKDVRETYGELKKELGGDVDIACIGPAGENLVKFASIMTSVYNAGARGGPGAVMGSKNLKALAIRGSKGVTVAHPEKYLELVRKMGKRIKEDEGVRGLAEFGTSSSTPAINEFYAFPAYNFRGRPKDAEIYSGQYLVKAGFLKGRVACGSCPVGCHRHARIDEGKYAGTDTVGPEYETFSSIGAGTAIDTRSTIKANDLCNVLGLDTISAGTVIQWAMECVEKGVITSEDTNGLDLSWGNDEAVMKLLEDIAHRRGFGEVLADGVKGASEKVGGDSWKWAVQAKGLEQSRVETRIAKAYALAFAVNPRGPDHLHTEPFAEFGLSEDAKTVIENITGDRKLARPGITEKRPEIVRWHEDVYAVTDSLGLCAFLSTACFIYTPRLMAQLFSAKTGIEMTEDELMTAGRRTVTVERCYNIREGLDRSDDVLPWRIMNEPTSESPLGRGLVTSKEELDEMLDKYYKLHGWAEDGKPMEETLEKLGLQKFRAK